MDLNKPYALVGSANVAEGYDEAFCVKCYVSPLD